MTSACGGIDSSAATTPTSCPHLSAENSCAGESTVGSGSTTACPHLAPRQRAAWTASEADHQPDLSTVQTNLCCLTGTVRLLATTPQLKTHCHYLSQSTHSLTSLHPLAIVEIILVLETTLIESREISLVLGRRIVDDV